MLILQRKRGESIRIITPQGDHMTIHVLKSSGRVRLGFEGDDAITIHRSEVYDGLQEENPSETFGFPHRDRETLQVEDQTETRLRHDGETAHETQRPPEGD